MDYGIFNVRTDANACDCTMGCTDTVRESALKVDSGRKITRRPGNRTCVGGVPVPTDLYPYPGSPASGSKPKVGSGQVRSGQSLDRSGLGGGGGGGTIQQSSSSSLFCGRPSWAVPARAGKSAPWHCPSSISSADRGVAHPPKVTWMMVFERESFCMRQVWTIRVSSFFFFLLLFFFLQLPKEVAVYPQGSWSCSTPGR